MKNTIYYSFFLFFFSTFGMDESVYHKQDVKTINKNSFIQEIITNAKIYDEISYACRCYDGNNNPLKEKIEQFSHVTKIQRTSYDVVQSPLDIALIYNNKHSVKLLLECTNQKAANYLTYNDHLFFFSSLKNVDQEIADLLFSCNFIQGQKDTLLRSALKGNISKAIVQNAIKYGANVNEKIEDYPFLIWALWNKNNEIVEIAKLLIASDTIDVNCYDPYTNDTPLHIAIKRNNLDIVQLLCKKEGIKLKEKNTKGYTPLHLIFFSNYINAKFREKMLQILCQYEDIGINELYKGETSLYRAIKSYSLAFNSIKILIDHKKIKINKQNENNKQTPLHIASFDAATLYEEIEMQILYMLLEKDADINIIDSNKKTSLDLILEIKYESEKKIFVVKLLKQYGAKTHAELCPSKCTHEKKEISDVDQTVQKKDHSVKNSQFFTKQKSCVLVCGIIALLLFYCSYKYNWHVLLHKNFV